jgi:phosphoribosylformylglycinamidine cyclo-ligase
MVPIKKLTYAEAGVDIDKSDEAVASLVQTLKLGRRGVGRQLDKGGFFTSLIDFGTYALSLCTDGVGSKVMIANAMRRWDTIGIDCIAMNVNDMICIGAEPLAFVDYLALEKVDPKLTAEIGIGLAKGAQLANITIVGGEIAVLPDIINGLDLSGACLGYVEKSRIINGDKVQVGDTIIGLESSGLHSNGYTLVRKIIELQSISYTDRFSGSSQKLGDVLLEPTRIYVREICKLISKVNVHGLVNITGGGLRNLPRVNKRMGYCIKERFRPQPIFEFIQREGNIDDYEMYQTFNMGMGFCIIVDAADADITLELLRRYRVRAKVVGEVVKGRGVTVPELGLKFKKF